MSTRLPRHELIRASAGSGKTYELTSRYLRLLKAGQLPEEILASTFTRKAAGEILGRVLLRLSQAATDDEELAELQTSLSDPSVTRKKCLALLVRTVRRLHRLRIGTLDSFFAQLADSFALEIGLPPGWRIVEEHEDAALRAQAIDAVLNHEDADSLLTLVHALTRGETTRSLDREVRDKVDTLYAVYRESCSEAWHRVPRKRELPGSHLARAIETLRTIPLAKHKTWEKNHAMDVEATETGDWAKFIKGGIAAKVAAGEDSYCRKPIDAAVAAAYQVLIDHAQAVLLNQLANQTEATYQLLDRFHTFYQQVKWQTRSLRFDDITWQLAQRAIAGQPRSGGREGASRRAGYDTGESAVSDHFAFRLDAQLGHLLLDEFQDTSLAQWSVIRPSAKRITAADSMESFFCVGDTKQAIYGWRGGVAEVFDAVTRELDDIQQRPLDTSWRSSPHIIATVNRIFQNLQRHRNLGDLAGAVAGWQRQFNEHHTAERKRGLNGYVCLQAARAARDEEGDPQKDITLRFAAEQVAQWKQKAPGFEIGVLVRRNDAVRRLIYELRELGIEASEEGGSTLDDSAAVRLVLSLVQLSDHPGDLVARFHVTTSPLAESIGRFGASGDTGETVGASLRDMDGAIRFASTRGDAEAGRLARRIRRQLLEDGYGPTVYALARQLVPSCNRREVRRLEKLIGLAYQYDDAATSRPRDFVAYVEAAKVRDPIAADVRVMTVHQAKGLEFDIVVLADLEANLIGQRDDLVVGRPSPTEPMDRICRRCNKEVQQLMPESWQRLFRQTDDRDVRESLCVLYVAVTRPVHALHMIVGPSAGNERSLHKTFGGLLRAALTDGDRLAPERIGFEFGDRQWHKDPGDERSPSPADDAARAELLAPLEVKLAAPAERRWRGLQRVSPSSMEGGRHVRMSVHGSDRGTSRAEALARGTLIHAWFEQIRWLDDGLPSDDQLRTVAARLMELTIPPEELERLLAEFRAMLDRPGIADCLRRDAYGNQVGTEVNVENERPFVVRDGDRLLVGTIDRLVTTYRNETPITADIIDFKTDVVPPNDAEVLDAKAAFYRPQIQAYRQAVCAMKQIPDAAVESRLLFVHVGKTVSI